MSTGTTKGRRTRGAASSSVTRKRGGAAKATRGGQAGRKRNAAASVSTTRSRIEASRPQDTPATVRAATPRRDESATQRHTATVSESARHDIAGVALAVAGVALFISVVSPGNAVVSAAVGRGMLLGLGIGAYVLPLMLIAWAVTFFLHTKPAGIRRAGIGLVLVAVAAIGLVAVWTPGADVAPATALFSETALTSRGGYAGNGIAWMLITLFGRGIGTAILVGVAIAGLIVIGLSISDLVERIAEHYRAHHLGGLPTRARPTLSAGAGEGGEDPWSDDDEPVQFDSNGDVVPRGERDYDAEPGHTTVLDTPEAREARARRHADGADATRVLRATKDDAADGSQASESAEEMAPLAAAPGTKTRRRKAPRASRGPHDMRGADQTRKLSSGSAVTQLLGRIGVGRGDSLRGDAAYDDPDSIDAGSVGQDSRDSLDSQDDLQWVAPEEVDRQAAPQTNRIPGRDAQEGGKKHAAPTTRIGNRESTPKDADDGAKVAAAHVPPLDSASAPTSDADDEGQVPFDEDDSEDTSGPIPGRVQEAHTSSQIVPAGSGVHAADATSPRRGDGDDVDGPFVLPDPGLLVMAAEADPDTIAAAKTECEQLAAELQQTLLDFSLDAKVVGWVNGPTVTQFKVEMPTGVRVNRITNLSDDIALALAAESVRVFAPIPGTSLVGVEVPNRTRSMVHFGDVISEVGPDDGPLTMAMGKDVDGTAILSDLARMPHLLIAGTTGSGKSVAENSMIMSMLMRATPDEVRMILIDPKRVEMSVYDGIPHLYVPVVTEPGEAASALTWGTVEMERRFKLIQKAGTRNIQRYNRMAREGTLDDPDAEPMPYLVIVIDELADLMMQARKEVENSICRIAQLGRAAGIHLIIATQRPSTDIVTGLIKANITNRMALKVASGIDSRVIIDQTGAENLLGYGDMLLDLTEWNKPRRIQGCFLTDQEIHAVCDHLRSQGTPDYHEDILKMGQGTGYGGGAADVGDDDPLVWDAAEAVVSMGFGSTSGLQRRLKVGYARAGRIMDMLEAKGVVGPPDGTKPREVLVDAMELESLKAFEQADRDGMTGGGA